MKKFLIGIFVGICLLLSTAMAHAFQVQVAWNPNAETDISEYRVYIGTNSRVYDHYYIATPGEEVGFIVPEDLPDGTMHYFAITAVNWGGLESPYSNEVRSDGVTNPSNNAPSAPGGCYIVSVL